MEKHDKHWSKYSQGTQWRDYEGYLWIDTPVRDCAYHNDLPRLSKDISHKYTYKDDKHAVATLRDKFLNYIKSFPDFIKQEIKKIKDIREQSEMQQTFNDIQQKMKEMEQTRRKQQAERKKLEHKVDQFQSQSQGSNDEQKLQYSEPKLEMSKDEQNGFCKFKPDDKEEFSPLNVWFGIMNNVERWLEQIRREIFETGDWFIKLKDRKGL